MRLLQAFEPRLAGGLLRGSESAFAPVELHLFSDDEDAVLRALLDAGIPYRSGERRLRLRERTQTIPLLSFVAGETAIEALIFPYDGLRQAPPSPVDGRPMARARYSEVEARLQALEDA
jgi:hypothetical protein